MLQNVTDLMRVQDDVANYYHDNLIEIYHIVVSQVV
jgi:hypothetical protein